MYGITQPFLSFSVATDQSVGISHTVSFEVSGDVVPPGTVVSVGFVVVTGVVAFGLVVLPGVVVLGFVVPPGVVVLSGEVVLFDSVVLSGSVVSVGFVVPEGVVVTCGVVVVGFLSCLLQATTDKTISNAIMIAKNLFIKRSPLLIHLNFNMTQRQLSTSNEISTLCSKNARFICS